MPKFYHSFIFFLVLYQGFAQSRFYIKENREKFSMSFELVNGLIIIPVEINGVELSFLLDTGVNSTIIFSLDAADSLDLRNAEYIFLRGLGGGEPFKALKSSGNNMKVGNAYNKDLSLYVVYENPIDLSNRMGVPIHGILGHEFLKDFILEINYVRKKLKVHLPMYYKYSQCKRCEDFDLVFNRNKPYVKVEGRINGEKQIPLNLLIDSGSSDALWVFKNKKEFIDVPEINFEDFLGYGMGGGIYGHRSRIQELKIGNQVLKEVTASFPDTAFFNNLETFEERNGSIGSQILSRFHILLDYPNQRLRLKPNRDIDNPFEYDMSGVTVAHEGYTVVKDVNRNPESGRKLDAGYGERITVFRSTSVVKYMLEPQYKVVELRPNSPAEKAGLQKGDILLTINGRQAYKYSLAEITEIFSSQEGKRIRLKIKRGGKEEKIIFSLKKVL